MEKDIFLEITQKMIDTNKRLIQKAINVENYSRAGTLIAYNDGLEQAIENYKGTLAEGRITK